MIIRIRPLLLAITIASILPGSSAWAADPMTRPRLENYRDYGQFLVDMAAYKKRLREAENGGAAGNKNNPARTSVVSTVTAPTQLAAMMPPPVPQVQAAPVAIPAIDLEGEDSPPPIVINGPEDLENAVEQAKNFRHPSYSVPRRYNRSTSQSFPLAPLESAVMEGSAISNMWPSSTPLPQTVANIDRGLLDDHALRLESAEDQLKRIAGAQKADEEEKKRKEQDAQDKAQGEQAQIVLPNIETVYFPGIAGPSGGAFDITIRRSDIKTSYHD